MSSKNTPSARELRKKKAVQIIALVACGALLLTAILPFFANAMF